MAKRKKKNRLPADVHPSLPPVRPGLLSPPRRVPGEIDRPPYALDGNPGPSVSALTRTVDELAAMRRTGAVAAEILLRAGAMVAPGVTTDKIDEFVHQACIDTAGIEPLNYRGYPKSVCTSVNEVICHGIPTRGPSPTATSSTST